MVTKKRKKWAQRSRESSMFGTAKAPDPFPISRSKLEAFHSCPRCFWIDRRVGIGRPGIPAFTLNSQVDTLLKREFDRHRAAGTPHPYMAQHGLGHMVPLDHTMMGEWRENFKGVRTQKHGLELFGAVDDIWKAGEGADEEWHVVDYKSTATNAELTAGLFLEDIYKGAFVRQMAIYQWLLRELGHPVSTRGFFVYENGNNAAESLLDGGPEDSPRGIPLKPVTVIEIDTADDSIVIEGERIDLDWVENLVIGARACLELGYPPEAGEYCEHCAYVDAASYGPTLSPQTPPLILPTKMDVGLDDSDCWFCGQPFDVEEDDCRFCEIFFEDSGGLLKTMDVPLCTPCGGRLTAEGTHPQAVRGPSVIFRVMYNDS